MLLKQSRRFEVKVVLDTNVLVSGIFWGGAPLKILNHWKKEKIELLTSDLILEEYLRTLQRLSEKMARPDLYKAWALILSSRLKLVSVKKSFRLCRDPNDDMFIDCAIAGKARYIISGDQDLLVLKQVMSVRIVDSKHFLLTM